MADTLLSEIEEFLSETGMPPYRFGFAAIKNGRLVERMRKGTTPGGKPVRIWPETAKQVRDFIKAERRKARNAPKAEQAA